jgi:hypothetical protein
MRFKPTRMTNEDIEAALEKQGLFIGQQANRGSKARLQMTDAQRDAWTTFFRAQAPEGPDIFSVMENGKPQYYRATDPMLASAVSNITKQMQLEKWFRTILGTPKNFLTHAITLNPAFMLRHLERQATHTFIQSGENFNPFKNGLDNALDAYTNSDFLKRLQMAGAGGNEYYNIDSMREAMRGMGVHSTVLDTGHKVWMAYRKIGFVADQMNRMGIAKAVRKRGGSWAEAAWQAQDLLNFSMHGDSVLMRHLVGAVPFLNARVQGMYRIIRGAEGIDQSYRARSAAVKSFMIKSAALIGASQLLALKNNGDPRYERLPDEAKQMYWHVFLGDHHFAIAKPFEIGAIFSSLPDAIVRKVEGLDGTGVFKDNLYRVFDTIFRFDVEVAAVEPFREDLANHDNLTQRPIVPEYQQSLSAPEQFSPSTSPFLKKLAQAMPDSAPNIMRSPTRFQHLVEGYVGNLGQYAIDIADSVVRATSNMPPSPAPRLGSHLADSAVGGMYTKPSEDARNRYVDMVYEDKQKLDTLARTVAQMKKTEDVNKINAYQFKNKSFYQYKNDIMGLYRVIGEFRKDETAIYNNPVMTPQQKRQALDKIGQQRNAVLDKAAPMLNLADDLGTP